MCCDWTYTLRVLGFNLDLLGHLVITHFERLRSMCDHFMNLWSLVTCGWICFILSVIIARIICVCCCGTCDGGCIEVIPHVIFLKPT